MSRTGHFPKKWPRPTARVLPARILLPALLMGIALAAPAPQAASVTVGQLDQLLGRLRAQNDVKAAREIAGAKLTERASAAWLAMWEADLKGDRTREALMAGADFSAFLEPPAAERPQLPLPDAAAQKQMLARTRDNVKQILSRMPNFLSLRTTTL